MPEFQKVAVIGLGYIGLAHGGADRQPGHAGPRASTPRKTSFRPSRRAPFTFPNPISMVSFPKVVSSGSLTTSTKPEPADVFIIAVPTPIDRRESAGSVERERRGREHSRHAGAGQSRHFGIDLADRYDRGIAKRISGSAAPTCMSAPTARTEPRSVAYCPERVLPGRILTELINNDRCIGGITPACTRRAQRFYKMFVRGACVPTTARAAELVKLTENAFRDTNIAFANELSLICDRFDINVWEVIDIANRHPRVNVLRPGPGVGGHCIAVDPWFIIDSAPDLARVMRTSREVNNGKTHEGHRARRGADRRSSLCKRRLLRTDLQGERRRPARKPGDGYRAASRGQIWPAHQDRGAELARLPVELADHGVGFMDIDEALRSCEIAILLVDHDEFKMVSAGRAPAPRRHRYPRHLAGHAGANMIGVQTERLGDRKAGDRRGSEECSCTLTR